MAVRKAIFRAGLRYRIDVQLEPGLRVRADIVFRSVRVAVFIDGCFWHGCPKHATQPKSNGDWWALKLEANRARDARGTENLQQLGWNVLRFWEHEDPETVAQVVESVVTTRRIARDT